MLTSRKFPLTPGLDETLWVGLLKWIFFPKKYVGWIFEVGFLILHYFLTIEERFAPGGLRKLISYLSIKQNGVLESLATDPSWWCFVSTSHKINKEIYFSVVKKKHKYIHTYIHMFCFTHFSSFCCVLFTSSKDNMMSFVPKQIFSVRRKEYNE